MRRTASDRCAREASGHVATPPSAAINSGRPMLTGMGPLSVRGLPSERNYSTPRAGGLHVQEKGIPVRRNCEDRFGVKMRNTHPEQMFSALPPILLQKSKVASVRFFGETLKREAVADSDNLSRATEVAYEFSVRR